MSADEFGNWDPGPLEPGERLVISTGIPTELGHLDYTVTEEGYIASFREAGEILSTATMNGTGDRDLLLFPTLFCYRHWLELQLKGIIDLRHGWRGKSTEPAWGHDLVTLWEAARAAIEAAIPRDPVDLGRIEAIITELAEIDPRSFSFRYARDRNGTLNLPRGVARINVGHFASVMLKVAILLDEVADRMSGTLDAASEEGH